MNTVSQIQPPQLDADHRRRAFIRSAAAAIREVAPLSVIDPRGIIFDPTRSGSATLRVRGEGASHVLVPLTPGPVDESTRWRVVPLEEDAELPGTALLRDGASGLQELCGIPGPLRWSVLTHRLGRRAVLRVSGEGVGRCRYVKLLTPKAYGRALRSFSALHEGARRRTAVPVVADESLSALVFDEVPGVSVHDSLWVGDPIDVKRVLAGVAAFASREPDGSLPRRDLATERASALRALELSGRIQGTPAPLEELLRATWRMPDLPGKSLLHGDLHDKQLFVDGRDLHFIDAEGVARGSPFIDLINLSEHFRLRGAQGCPGGPALAARLESEAGVEPGDPGVRVLRGLTRARLAGIYGCRPWWWGMAAGLAGEAASLLAEAQ